MAKKHRTSKTKSSGSKSKHLSKGRNQNLFWLWLGLGIIIVVVGGYFLWFNKDIPTEISATQAYQKYQQGAFILDVRGQKEWEEAHIINSVPIPLDELRGRLGELPKDEDIVVVCLSGVRSKEGVTILQQAGFSRVSCLTGGLTAWQAGGYPLENSSP